MQLKFYCVRRKYLRLKLEVELCRLSVLMKNLQIGEWNVVEDIQW